MTYEDPRLDFTNVQEIPASVQERLDENLTLAVRDSDVLLVCDQMEYGCIGQAVQDRFAQIAKRILIVVDSRDRIGQYHGVIIKPNEVEAAGALGLPPGKTKSPEFAEKAATCLSQQTGNEVVVTLGEQGAIWSDGMSAVKMPACPVAGPIDFVGAGDSFLSGLACGLGLHLFPEQFLLLGNLVSAVTIQKIGVTGTASPKEIMTIWEAYCGKGGPKT